jgi:hypothetical protein
MAVELATQACDLSNWKEWTCLATLGAAHAENGNFAGAIEWTEQALEHAPVLEQPGLQRLLGTLRERVRQ